MALKGITVNTEASAEPHIYAEDDAAIYQSIWGSDGVFNIGSCLAATVLSNNKVRIADGVACIGGHICRQPYAEYEDMKITNGTSRMNRNDIIVARFKTTGTGGIDTFTLAVVQGTAATTASDPAVTQEDIYEAGKTRELPLYRVKIKGLSIVQVDQLFTVLPTIPQLKEQISDLNSALPQLQEQVSDLISDLNSASPQLQKQISDLNSALSNLTITKIMRFNLYLELSANTNSYALFTLSKLNKLFGVSGATAPCFTILVNNADGEAFGSHIDSCTWLNGNTFYITWNEVLSVNKNARVYVTVFYTPLANVIKSI